MTRQFEFSVDSFHIILDSLIKFYECSEMPISENIYPTVLAESVYGNFNEALSHLVNKVIATRQVEEIRGGGLLKYIALLIRNYTPSEDIKKMERYMCSRFFIDFSELPAQRNKLESYLASHFVGDDWTKTQYLMQLYKVVDESTVCLMGHERRQTLHLIEEMAYRFYIRSQQQQTATTQHATPHHYSLHFPHIGKQANQPFFPHVHHHLIRPHFDYDLIVAPQQQTTNQSNSNKFNQNSDSNASTNKNSSSTAVNAANNSTNSNSNSTTVNSSNSAQSTSHSTNHQQTNNSSVSTNCKGNKNQSQQQQHIQQQQQQYHAYLFAEFGTGATNTFYYNPYHHHSMHHQAHNCFNSMACQCGVWMACAWDVWPQPVFNIHDSHLGWIQMLDSTAYEQFDTQSDNVKFRQMFNDTYFRKRNNYRPHKKIHQQTNEKTLHK